MTDSATVAATAQEVPTTPPKKPTWRGWIHLVTAPVTLAAGVVLVCLARSETARTSTTVFALTAVLLFGTSAIYHRGSFSFRTTQLLRRLDHSNIMLVIAGTYTPIAALALPASQSTPLLWTIWGATAAGILFRLLWTTAPRWLYVPIYCSLGLAGSMFTADFFARSVVIGVLLLVGGGLYIAGALIYATKWPALSRTHFGFHELFHCLTVLAFACHFTASMFAIYL